jgi:hypothetical protein
MDRLLAIERTSSGLNALVVRRPKNVDPPTPTIDWSGWLEFVRIPLSEYPGWPEKRILLQSWEELSRVNGASAETLVNLLILLIKTIAVPCRTNLPRPQFDAPIIPPKPTAAHPRAYSGTKWKPPKNVRAGKLDLHPHLCDERHITALLEEMRPHAEIAGNLLEKADFRTARIGRVIKGLKKLSSCDPWILYHFNHQNGPNIQLSPEWRQLASHINENELRRLLALRGRLPIEQNTALHAACAWLAINENGIDWLELIASIPMEQQVPFATMAAWNSSPALKPGQINPEFITIHAGIPQSQYLHRATTYLSGLANGLSCDYLMAGFRLARACAPNHSFRLPLRSSPVPEQLLNDIAACIIEECNYIDWLMMSVWRALGTLQGLAEFLTKVPWTDLSPSGTVELLRFFVDLAPDYSESIEDRIAIWREIQKPLLSAISGMKDIPVEHQKNWASMLGSALCDVQPSKISKQIKPLLVLTHRLSQPPLPETTHLGYAIEPFWRTDDGEVRKEFITAPEDSFLKFEKVCSRPGASGLIGYSMKAIVQLMPHFALEAFIQFPENLARTARFLGMMAKAEIYKLLKQFMGHPAVCHDPFASSPAQLVRLLSRWCIGGVQNPLPRKIREHFEGKCKLSTNQVERGMRIARQKLMLLRLQILEQITMHHLKRRMPVDLSDPRQRHAIEMANVIDRNRRGLRRFLSRYLAGERDWLIRHPATQQWFRRHPRINPAIWLSGISLTAEIPPHGSVQIRLETEPLEALRLGTYVGSCLSVGGLCDYSAATVVLDVNKQVLYAVDSKGTILARQLVAISEADELVTFYVYPLRTSEHLKTLFREYDLRLAAALGIPLANLKNDYDIASILSQDFWDDGAWNPKSNPKVKESSDSISSAIINEMPINRL